MNKEDFANQLKKHIYAYGIEGLLPQNLTDKLLNRMILEADALEYGTNDETLSLTLLVAVLHLVKGTDLLSESMEMTVTDEELREYFIMYIICLGFEEIRRKKDIDIPLGSLPTVKNIFDITRNVEITIK